jgi:alpha-1,4-digalacturonate transport system permease protein
MEQTMKKQFKVNVMTVNYIIAFFLVLMFLLPVLYVISSSFKGTNELFSSVPTFFPRVFTFENYVEAIGRGDFLRYIFNSIFVSVTSTALAVIINTMSGYALAKFRFKGETIIMMLILSTIMLPLEVIMVPIFSVLRTFGMYDSLIALIVPAAATPTGIFLMRQYLLTIPNDLIESARIDGASEWKIFTRIILPNAKPAISTLAIFSFMWRWNDYIWPLIAISSPEKYTLQLAIANFTGEFGVDYNSILAMSAISMIPMLVIFLIFQRQFVQGTVQSGLKG